MRQNGYNFGGEQSGHLIFLDHNTTGDGILAGLQLLAIMIKSRTGRSPNWPPSWRASPRC
jgi:phosphoglucosamine mutase